MKTVTVELYGNPVECWLLAEHPANTIDVEVKKTGKCYRISGVMLKGVAYDDIDKEAQSDEEVVSALLDQFKSMYAATNAINEQLEKIGLSYRVTQSTINQMGKAGKGKPGMMALVRLLLEQLAKS